VNNIFLIGPMGVGKTTIGTNLARLLRYEFLDSDHEIEERTGASISLIFDIEGEEGFREREARMIEELTERDRIVLSTGGGSVLSEASGLDRCALRAPQEKPQPSPDGDGRQAQGDRGVDGDP